jgi:hypothetical protein
MSPWPRAGLYSDRKIHLNSSGSKKGRADLIKVLGKQVISTRMLQAPQAFLFQGVDASWHPWVFRAPRPGMAPAPVEHTVANLTRYSARQYLIYRVANGKLSALRHSPLITFDFFVIFDTLVTNRPARTVRASLSLSYTGWMLLTGIDDRGHGHVHKTGDLAPTEALSVHRKGLVPTKHPLGATD